MNRLFNIFIVIILATIMTGCGSYDNAKMYDKTNYESITNENGILTLWSGGKIMAVFPEMEIDYSPADSDALYFTDKKGSSITLRDTKGDIYTIRGIGDQWYSSPGVLINLGH
jgi:hypothetical protein